MPITQVMVCTCDCCGGKVESDGKLGGRAEIPRGWVVLANAKGDFVLCPGCARKVADAAIPRCLDPLANTRWTEPTL